jgi:cobalt-zinc-cadmium efflux system outer membrane protein
MAKMKNKIQHPALSIAIGLIILNCQLLTINGLAQVDTSLNRHPVSFTEYLSLVGKNNLSYAAEKFNVNIAEAGIEIAKVFPDPDLSFGTFNNQNEELKLGYGFTGGISTTIELGGKRKARINLAASQTELSKAVLNDYFRNLRAAASVDYYNSLQQYFLLTVQLNSYQTMKQLADADSIRFKFGAIKEIDARQSKLEAASMLNTVFQNEANWKTSLVQLGLNTGVKQTDTLFFSSGSFENLDRNFSLDSLIITAQNNRADLVAALQSKEVAQKTLQLVKANRTIDLGVQVGANYNSAALSDIAPVPAYHNFNAGVSIPLKFSNRYKGDLKAANFSIQQADFQYQQVLLQIQTDVSQAYFNYIASKKQVLQFNTGLLTEGKKILDGEIYSYKRGETSLLEVLNAHRTYNDLQQGYYGALFSYASALIQVERSAGIWDIK